MSDLIDLSHMDSLVLLAGISGAGKSKALDVLSDLGFFNLENLPVSLVRQFIEFTKSSPGKFRRTVLGVDIDSADKLTEYMGIIEQFSPRHGKVHLIFLDCSNETLIRRYSETRRPHPSFDPIKDSTLEDAILRERNRLLPFREQANLLIDTSNFTIHDLKRELKEFVDSLSSIKEGIIRVNFISFGYKYGVPRECDLVIDVRFLANPYFVDHLREKTGLEADVSAFVLETDASKEFVNRYTSLLEYLLPLYMFEGKYYLNIGVGCTGGRHRSVALSEALAKRIASSDYLIGVKHRDMEKHRVS